MDRKYYKVENRADGAADILIYGAIGDSWFEESVTAKQFVADLKSLEKNHPTINIRINSPGGSVWDGLAIFNALSNSTAQIHTWNDGLAASMAAVILFAGSKIHAAKNSLMMVHSPSTMVAGNRSDLEKTIAVLDKVQNSLVECMLQHCEKTKEEILAGYFNYEDHWLSAEEALQEGFIDEVIEKQAAVPKKVTDMSYREMVARFQELVPEQKPKSKLVAFFENLFAPAIEEGKITDEMDKNTLIAALSLASTATEQEILDAIQKMASDLAAEKAASSQYQAEVSNLKTKVTEVENELEELKKAPGAKPAQAVADTDAVTADNSAKDFVGPLNACFEILK